MKKIILSISVLFCAGSAFGDDTILKAGQESIEIRLLDKTNEKRCLRCSVIPSTKKEDRDRIVMTWSDSCSDDSSVFRYFDGGGYTDMQCKSQESFLGFIVRPGLDLVNSEHVGKNLFTASNVNQLEFTNSMTADLIQSKDGSYTFAALDVEGEEEGMPTAPLCISSKNLAEKEFFGSAEVIDYPAGDKSPCAQIAIKK